MTRPDKQASEYFIIFKAYARCIRLQRSENEKEVSRRLKVLKNFGKNGFIWGNLMKNVILPVKTRQVLTIDGVTYW